MRPPPTAAAVILLHSHAAPTERVQRGGYANKLPVRQVEAALVMETGTLKVRLTLATNEALDYEVRDEAMIDRVLRFIEVSSSAGLDLAAEVSTEGKKLRALHLASAEGRPRR